ncbi:MAG: hypothetical protein Q7T58_04020 [Methylotenera sp.]|nr:hypothetical protein [Methylotenera sp.]
MLMTNFTRFIVMLSMIELLTACATNGDNAQQPALHHNAEIAQQMTDIYAVAASKEMLFIEVPSANNIISEKIMLAVIASGESTPSIEQLSVLLQKGTHMQIGVVGKSQSTNIMTIKQALKKLASKPAKGVLYLVGNAKTKEELSVANQHKDIVVVVVDTKP